MGSAYGGHPSKKQEKKPDQPWHAIHSYTSLSEAAFKKNGEPFQAPRRGGGVSSSLLERESQPKCEQPHRRVIFDVGNPPGIATTIDTSIALGVAEAHDRVVKYVVGIHAELRLVTLGDAEVLRAIDLM